MRSLNIIIVIVIALIYFNSFAIAYDKEVHKKLNQEIANQSNIRNLLYNIGIKNDPNKPDILDNIIGNKTIKGWLSFGGEAEDYGYWPKDSPDNTRAFNHFHNPLKEWDDAGLDNFALKNLYFGNYLRYPVSTILWGLDYGRQDFLMNFTGDWSWNKAKELFYIYLTGNNYQGDEIASTEAERNAYFADSLRAVGQVMHLLQDMSVPLHTRNDVHILPLSKNQKASWTYETYASDQINYLNYIAHFPDKTLINIPNPDSAYYDISPVSGLFDRNQYDGSAALENNELIGLAEYSNANFFTDDTMWDDKNNYPYPSKEQTNYSESWWNINYIEQIDAEDGEKDNQIYITKQNADGSKTHLAVARYWIEEIATSIGSFVIIDHGLNLKYGFEMNETCWKDNADALIPRAVGYSAALLDYFFRGNIEISATGDVVYSLVDDAISPQLFTYIKAKLRNITPKETDYAGQVISYDQMGSGTLLAVAKYKKRTDYQEDLLTDPPEATSRENYLSYSMSAPIEINSLDSGNSTEFTFDFSSNPIPIGITDLYLQVIFKGTLGNEVDDAIAIGMKDLNEPMHITVWNSTDRFYLDGVLRTASEIRGNSSLRTRVDLDNDGILNETEIGEPYIDPYNLDTEISFYAPDGVPGNINASYSLLPYGKYGRLIFLSDDLFNIRINRTAAYPPTNDDTDFILSGVVNQETSEGVFQNTDVSAFRGIRQHNWHSYAGYYPFITGISTAPWPEVTDGPVKATTINP